MDSNSSPILKRSETWTDEAFEETVKLWNLNEKQAADLKLLGERLKDIDHDFKNTPSEVVRFYKATGYNVKAAEKRFRHMISWRADNKIDSILDDFQPDKAFLDRFPGAILKGRDRDGDAIFVGRSGSIDSIGLHKAFGHQFHIDYTIWIRELATRGEWIEGYEKEQGRRPTQVTMIDDAHNLPLMKIIRHGAVLKTFGDCMRLDQDFYPEMAKKIIVIRAPPLFHVIWNIAKNFFDKNMREKITVCTEKDYEKVLKQHLDLEVLPNELVSVGKGEADLGMPRYFCGGKLKEQKS